MKVFVINGSGGCGKDTFVEYVAKMMKEVNGEECVFNISTVDPIRSILPNFGLDPQNKTEQLREFMSKLKAVWKEVYNGPVEYAKSTAFETINRCKCEPIVFIHSREPEEIEELKITLNHGGSCSTILVDASERVPVITSNASDANVANYMYDTIINNNMSLENLVDRCKVFCEINLK